MKKINYHISLFNNSRHGIVEQHDYASTLAEAERKLIEIARSFSIASRGLSEGYRNRCVGFRFMASNGEDYEIRVEHI